MNERIQRLVHQVLTSDINPPTHEIEYDPFDEKLSEPMFVAKRFCEFYNAQPIMLGDDNELIGHIRFDMSPVPADIFHRFGHAKFHEVSGKYYGKPQGISVRSNGSIPMRISASLSAWASMVM